MKTIGIKNNKKNTEKLTKLITKSLDKNKAEDIQIIDLEGKSDIADVMIIATGRSERHIKSLAEYLLDILKDNNTSFVVEGMDNKDWVLVDAFNVIVHLFKPETREHYNLENMWSK